MEVEVITTKKAMKKTINKLIDNSKYEEAIEKIKLLREYERYMKKNRRKNNG